MIKILWTCESVWIYCSLVATCICNIQQQLRYPVVVCGSLHTGWMLSCWYSASIASWVLLMSIPTMLACAGFGTCERFQLSWLARRMQSARKVRVPLMTCAYTDWLPNCITAPFMRRVQCMASTLNAFSRMVGNFPLETTFHRRFLRFFSSFHEVVFLFDCFHLECQIVIIFSIVWGIFAGCRWLSESWTRINEIENEIMKNLTGDAKPVTKTLLWFWNVKSSEMLLSWCYLLVN